MAAAFAKRMVPTPRYRGGSVISCKFQGAVASRLTYTSGLPVWVDSRAKFHGVKLKKAPSEYIKENLIVTTSGMCSAEPLNCTISALGRGRVMFSADHPFEEAHEAGEWLDHVPLDETLRTDIASGNAARFLGLPQA